MAVVATEGSEPQRIQHDWRALIDGPICRLGSPTPHLHVVLSRYRRMVKPVIRAVQLNIRTRRLRRVDA